MRTFSLLLLLLCVLSGSVKAANIHGTVYSVATCSVVSGLKVYARDTASNWLDSTVTNSTGQYSITIPTTVANPSWLDVTANACGVVARTGAMYYGANVHRNLFTCGNWGILAGNVKLGANPATGSSIIYLIRQDVMPVTFDTVLTAVDSASITGGYYNLAYACVPTSGTYLLKVALQPGNPNYSSYLPTYYGNVLNWNNATVLAPSNYTSYNTDITLVAGTNPGGPAFIGGSVLLGANKSAGVGDPLAKRLLIVTNASNGQAVAYTYSDAAGKFQFPSLPYGTYHIFGDAMGKANPKLAVTVSSTEKTVNNIIFEENDSKFEGHLNTTGIDRASALEGVSVFPNPATDFIYVKGLAAFDGNKTITLSNVTGTIISREIIAGGDASISTGNLSPGIYLLQLQTIKGNGTFQIVK